MKKETFILKNHDKDKKDIEIQASFEIDNKILTLKYRVIGDIKNYIFNEPSIQERKDELWKESCFELFIANRNNSLYYELNISPSTNWNFYHFSDYKTDMKEEKNISEPFIHSSKMQNEYKLSFEFEFYEELIEKELIFNLAVILLDTKGNEQLQQKL
ncbi:hypothetical protein MNB_SV-13-134 [hydrothermal vent metagenome]|uniref:Uncharacterized protein n=1 Tax=hydrothermal vent metagenome TaxID=652676 RepID=A0A1W1D009_9ZZZZ